MSYQKSQFKQFQVLHLTGEVDLSNSAKMRGCLLELLDTGKNVLIDFTNLIYLDSSGIATLIEALSLAKEKQLELAIVGANGAPLQVLELTRLNQVFTLYDNFDEVDSE